MRKIINGWKRLVRFLKEVRSELRKVTWPTRRQTVVFTSVVLLSVAAVAALIWVVDTALSFMIGLILR